MIICANSFWNTHPIYGPDRVHCKPDLEASSMIWPMTHSLDIISFVPIYVEIQSWTTRWWAEHEHVLQLQVSTATLTLKQATLLLHMKHFLDMIWNSLDVLQSHEPDTNMFIDCEHIRNICANTQVHCDLNLEAISMVYACETSSWYDDHLRLFILKSNHVQQRNRADKNINFHYIHMQKTQTLQVYALTLMRLTWFVHTTHPLDVIIFCASKLWNSIMYNKLMN